MDSALAVIFLPIALGIVMLGLGLGLTTADFTRVLAYPGAVLAALACQVVLLPIACFGLVLAFDLPPLLAVGMMLLAASPGGTTANLYSHLFGGDVALNVTLTAINSVLAVFTLPIIVNVSLAYFVGGADTLGLQFSKVAQVFLIVLVPVALGMVTRRRWTRFAELMHRPVKVLSVLVLVSVIVGAVAKERETLTHHLGDVGLIAAVFSIISLGTGYLVPRLLRIGPRQAVASSMEVGIHNSTLAITIALSPALLDSTEMAVPPALYGIIMFFTAAAVGIMIRPRAQAEEPVAASTVP
jgi:BASS family bile acid:Na+ symporter